MASIITDNIDFAAYMADTDHEHKVRSTGVFLDDVIAYYNSPAEQSGDRLTWQKTHDQIRFRPGEVTLWGGMSGHGKSLVLGQACLGFVQQGRKVCIASMEMKPVMSLARMCRQAFCANQPDVEFIREFHRRTDRKLFLYDQQGSVRAEKMLAVIRYCADRLKVEHFVIDSLMKCGIGEDDYNAQKAFIDGLTVAARDSGIHIHLVAHSRKAKDEYSAPGKMDVKGTGSITDQVDNVVTVWRNKGKERDLADGKGDLRDPDTLLICDKQRNGEWEGKIALWFDQRSFQFVEHGTATPVEML